MMWLPEDQTKLETVWMPALRARKAVEQQRSGGQRWVFLPHTFTRARPEVSVPHGGKEVLQSEETPQTHYFRMRNCSRAFLSGFLLETKLSRAKNNLSGESLMGRGF